MPFYLTLITGKPIKPINPDGGNSDNRRTVIIGIAIGGTSCVLGLCLGFLRICIRRKRAELSSCEYGDSNVFYFKSVLYFNILFRYRTYYTLL